MRTLIYKRIKIRRLMLFMSQEELAEKIGYTDRSMISKIEHGEVDLTISKAMDIAEALNTSIQWLLGNQEPKERRKTHGKHSRETKQSRQRAE